MLETIANVSGSIGHSSESEPICLIGELAERLGTSAVTIRFYEKEGLITPKRIGRFRAFRTSDEARLRAVVEMRNMGIPIVRIKEALDVFELNDPEVSLQSYRRILADHLEVLKLRAELTSREIAVTLGSLNNLNENTFRRTAELAPFV